MRLFLAINFNNDTRSRLTALRDEVRVNSSRGNFTLAENLHLTLVFLGECDARQLTAAKSAIVAAPFTPFEIIIDRVGRFKRVGGDIWWAGVAENKRLIELYRNLTGLLSAGFELENRKYSPHITFGREVVTDINPRQIKPFGEKAIKVDLMKSERINGKLTYTTIY